VEIAGQTVKIGLAEAKEESTTVMPGTVLASDGSGFLVTAGRGTLSLLKLQRPGGRMLTTAEFLRGFPVAPGLILNSLPMKSLVAREPFKRVTN
jgi:methionyl-tRNA formyltransferase